MADTPVLGPEKGLHPPNPTQNPWATARRRRGALQPFDAASATALAGEAPPSGIERRLSNRAQALWMRLRGERRLPSADGATALLAPPFAAQAMRVERSRGGLVTIREVGAELLRMQFAHEGTAMNMAASSANATLGVGERAVALALEAIAAGQPLHLDSDFDPDIGGPRPAILFRAVALPFAPEAGQGLTGVAVALISWRTLLSQAETDDLHRELGAAIAWLANNSR
ncbi:hypothetical protein FJQ54_14210 [Sandaracinobacter neustonicus]|uniref:Uncharacterized protein n=1 Tax=Sandaracinobacter neustonicus TaxID=1715348 RepID=A0A501XFZ6_9SPHN|nr:hypothetical protein [Sandaracinobacter neustonicus]TPE59214.1 hypothetical protein FJQ54_14210 [Sandaracinobacter neustonicus]